MKKPRFTILGGGVGLEGQQPESESRPRFRVKLLPTAHSAPGRQATADCETKGSPRGGSARQHGRALTPMIARRALHLRKRSTRVERPEAPSSIMSERSWTG